MYWTAIRRIGVAVCLAAGLAVATACTEEDQANLEQSAEQTAKDARTEARQDGQASAPMVSV